jgi:cytochrome o ubiquinol oxidase subunit I
MLIGTPSNACGRTQIKSRKRANTSPLRCQKKSSAIGFVNAFFAVVTGFALIWHIWWMAGLGLLGAFVTLLAFAFRNDEEVEITVAQIAQFDRRHRAEVAI